LWEIAHFEFKKKKAFFLKELCKTIKVNGQRYYYLIYLKDDLINSFDIKYILGIINVFSHKTLTYKYYTNNSGFILYGYCLINEFPSELSSFNGIMDEFPK